MKLHGGAERLVLGNGYSRNQLQRIVVQVIA
jgi:hypothetical protein